MLGKKAEMAESYGENPYIADVIQTLLRLKMSDVS